MMMSHFFDVLLKQWKSVALRLKQLGLWLLDALSQRHARLHMRLLTFG
jgi:hypothetical protein